METRLSSAFAEVLEVLGENSAEFYLAASLYHARKVSFSAAAALADMDPSAFHDRLRENFGYGFLVADEVVLEDLETVQKLT
jgi:hypothetical protein